VESVLDFVRDQLYLIAVGIFAVASFGIISWSRRRQLRSSGRFGLAGLRTAAIASVAAVVILALVLLPIGWLVSRLTYPTSTPQPMDPAVLALDAIVGLLWLVSIPGVTFLAVLDLYAVRPPRLENQAGAAKSYAVLGTLCSLLLMGGALLVPALIDGAAASAAARDAQEETASHTREVKARSAGLALEVTVVDAELGAPTENGKFVEQLTLDITVRSATEIELRQGDNGLGSNGLLLDPAYAPDAGYTPPMYLDLKELPTHIPAGFNATYRIDVPVEGTFPADHLQPDPVTTGSWGATLVLYDRYPGRTFKTSVGSFTLWYETSTDFTVSDAP
jgi:hypothetical protein